LIIAGAAEKAGIERAIYSLVNIADREREWGSVFSNLIKMSGPV